MAHILGVALVIIAQANAKKQITLEFQAMMTRVGKLNQSGSRMQTNPETMMEMSSRGLASKFLKNLAHVQEVCKVTNDAMKTG
jgi:hypothetical protein